MSFVDLSSFKDFFFVKSLILPEDIALVILFTFSSGRSLILA